MSTFRFDAHDFESYLEEYEVPHSGALFTRVKATGKPVFTSALSRLNASWDHLSQEAKFASAKAGLRPEDKNPMKNNLAQAIEILDALIRCAGICVNWRRGRAIRSQSPLKCVLAPAWA